MDALREMEIREDQYGKRVLFSVEFYTKSGEVVYFSHAFSCGLRQNMSQMEEWARATQKLSKAQAALFTKGKRRNRTYKSGKKAGKTEGKLRNRVQFQMKSDSGEVAGVAFQFPVHGIFKEYGVSSGYPASGHMRRSMSEWISSALGKQDERLADIVAEYQSGKVLRTFRAIGGKTTSWNIN